MDDVAVTGPLTLGSFLKLAGAAATGGHAKILVQSGDVIVNGEPETRRGRMLQFGDSIEVGGREYRVWSSPA
jgi:ribosome-associated protein